MIQASPDNFLVLKVGEVEIVLTPESRIFKKGDDGLYVPWLELPGAMLLFDLSKCDLEYMETLDTYLVNYTSMPAPETDLRDQLALVDEHGQVVGEVAVDSSASESTKAALERLDSTKEPVIIGIEENGDVTVEKFKDSKIVSGATYVSSGILYGASAVSSGLERGSSWLTARSPAVTKDVEFSARTKASTRRVHQLSTGVSHVSSKTVGYVAALAERAGGKLAGNGKKSADGKSGKPGFLAQSAYALVTLLDAVDQGGKQIIGSASENVERVVQHRYGSQAGEIANDLGGSVKNVALVYFDAKGISHRALLKSSIKGGIRARMSDGRQVVLTDEPETALSAKTTEKS